MNNKKGNKKKGLFTRLAENKKSQKNSCCCNIELEEIPEENNESTTVSPSKEKCKSSN